MNRREFLPLAAAGLLSGVAGFQGGRTTPLPGPDSAKVSLRKARYQDDLTELILESFREQELDVTGARVLLKPHLAGPTTSTHPALVAAAYAAVEELGAAQVRIGDAPMGDALALAEAAGYRQRIPNFDEVFVDLNGDDVCPVQGFLNGPEVYFPDTAIRADLVISLGKLSTDRHFTVAGAITNLFGLVPSSVYGSPKDAHPLRTAAGASELVRIFRRSFGIVDGIVALEGDGDPKQFGVLALGRDLVAVDATCSRIMGLNPKKIDYLRISAAHGVVTESGVEQTGESIEAVRAPFRAASV